MKPNMMKMKILTYKELLTYKTFEERYNYLNLHGIVGDKTFGVERYLNQMFYRSSEWKEIREYVITRDNGCDLGIRDMEILGSKIYVHHMNPITIDDIIKHSSRILDPNELITVSLSTHNALHYGEINDVKNLVVERKPNDTCPWKK